MKNNFKKRMLSFCVACILIITTGTFMVNAQEISPCYNNVVSAQSQANVSSTGVITITNNYVADSTVFSMELLSVLPPIIDKYKIFVNKEARYINNILNDVDDGKRYVLIYLYDSKWEFRTTKYVELKTKRTYPYSR